MRDAEGATEVVPFPFVLDLAVRDLPFVLVFDVRNRKLNYLRKVLIPKQFLGGGYDIGDGDIEQALFRFGVALVICKAAGAAQYDRSRSVGPVARWIGRAKNCDHRNLQSSRQVHGAGVAADEKAGTTGERDQL